MGAPAAHAAHDCRLNPRVLIEAEKTVGAEVDDALSGDLHLAVRAEVIDDDILEMGIGKFPGVMLDEPHEPILAKREREILHRGDRHASLFRNQGFGQNSSALSRHE
jgi:hypothetical protein